MQNSSFNSFYGDYPNNRNKNANGIPNYRKGNANKGAGAIKTTANSGAPKVKERALQGVSRPIGRRFSLLDYSIAKTVLGNMGSWNAVGIESGAISGACLWDAALIQWAIEVQSFFDKLYNHARVFLNSNRGKLRWCDCISLAWKALGTVKYLTEKLGHLVKEFRPVQAIRSAKHKIRAAARKVSNKMYKELFLVDEPLQEFTRLQNGLSLKKYNF